MSSEPKIYSYHSRLVTYRFRVLEVVLLEVMQGLCGIESGLIKIHSNPRHVKDVLLSLELNIILICLDLPPSGPRSFGANALDPQTDLIEAATDERIPHIIYGNHLFVKEIQEKYGEHKTRAYAGYDETGKSSLEDIVFDIISRVEKIFSSIDEKISSPKNKKMFIGRKVLDTFVGNVVDSHEKSASKKTLEKGKIQPAPKNDRDQKRPYNKITLVTEKVTNLDYFFPRADTGQLAGYQVESHIESSGGSYDDKLCVEIDVYNADIDKSILQVLVCSPSETADKFQKLRSIQNIWLDEHVLHKQTKPTADNSLEYEKIFGDCSNQNKLRLEIRRKRSATYLTKNIASELNIGDLLGKEIRVAQYTKKSQYEDIVLAYSGVFGELDRVLLTAIEKEMDQCKHFLENTKNTYVKLNRHGNDYLIYLYKGPKELIPIIGSCVEKKGGIARTAARTTELYYRYKPKIMVLAGIAAGIGLKFESSTNLDRFSYTKDLTPLGDIVVGQTANNYESERLSKPKQLRWDKVELDFEALVEFSKRDWKQCFNFGAYPFCDEYNRQLEVEEKFKQLKIKQKLFSSPFLDHIISDKEILANLASQIQIEDENFEYLRKLLTSDFVSMTDEEVHSLAKKYDSSSFPETSNVTSTSDISSRARKYLEGQQVEFLRKGIKKIDDQVQLQICDDIDTPAKIADLVTLLTTDLDKVEDLEKIEKLSAAFDAGKVQIEGRVQQVHQGDILSGDKLLADEDIRQCLIDTWAKQRVCSVNQDDVADLRALEMEASGFALAIKAITDYGVKDLKFSVVRSICDHGDSEKHDRWQNFAAVSAVGFVLEWFRNDFREI